MFGSWKGEDESTRIVWPRAQLALQGDAIAAKLGELLVDPTAWVHRRVETLTFLDGARVRRSTTVDFTFPHFPRLEGDAAGSSEYVPLARLRKEVLRGFDLRGEDGSTLPLLTRAQNAAIAGAHLEQQAAIALAEAGYDELDPWVVRALREIAGERIARPDEPPTKTAIEQWEAVFADDVLDATVSEFDEQFVLLVPLANRPLERRIVKFAYEEDIAATGATTTRTDRARVLIALLQSLGLLDLRWAAELAGVADCESYHVEVVVPSEMFVVEAVVIVDDVVCAHESAVARVHLHPEDDLRDTRDAQLLADLALRPTVLWPVALLTALTAGIVGSGLVLHDYGIAVQHDSASAIIVALPAFFAPFVAPGRHGLVRRMFGGLRALTVVAALVSFGAAATLGLDLSEEWTVGVWRALFAVAVLAAISACLALLRSAIEARPAGPSDVIRYSDDA
jgi:hypothetical protein